MTERDDRELTPAEEQQVRDALRGLGEVRADDAFRARLREQFVSGAVSGSVREGAVDPAPAAAAAPGTAPVVALTRRRNRWAVAGVAAVAALAAALVLTLFGGDDATWQLRELRGAGTVLVDGRAADAGDGGTVAALVRPGARFEVPEGVTLDLVLDDVMVVGVVGPADFVLPDAPTEAPYAYEATVNAGEFRFKSGPDFPGRRMVMVTTEGETVVTGTIVAVYKSVNGTCVCVLEGEARIGRDAGHMDPVPGGMRKVMFADGRDPMVLPIEEGHEASLKEFAQDNAQTFR